MRSRWVWARARALPTALIGLFLVAAAVAGLIAGVGTAVQATEAAAVARVLGDARGDRAAVIVRFDPTQSDAADVSDAVVTALARAGAGGSLAPSGSPQSDRLVYQVDPAGFTTDAAFALIVALPELGDSLEEALGVDVQVSGGLRSSLVSLEDGLQSRRAIHAVALATLILTAAVVMAAVAIDPVRVRKEENRLLRARGSRRRLIAGITGAETLVVAGSGALVGAALGVSATAALSGVRIPWQIGGFAAGTVVVVAVLAALVASVRGVDTSAGRSDLAGAAGAVVLLLVLTAIAVWQFTAMSARVGEGEPFTVDAIVVVAPGLVLVVAALVAVFAATPLAAAIANLSAGRRGVSPTLPFRLVARRPGRHSLTMGVVAIAVGSFAFAGCLAGTLGALGTTPEALRVGADVRVTGVNETTTPPNLGTTTGVEEVMAVRSFDARGAQEQVNVLAVESSSLEAVMLDADGAIDTAAVAERLAPRVDGIAIPAGVSALDVRIRAEARSDVDFDGAPLELGPAPLVAALWLIDEDGQLVVLDAPNFDIEESEFDGGTLTTTTAAVDRTVSLDVPDGEWSVAAVMVSSIEPFGGDSPVRIDVLAGGRPLDLTSLAALPGADIEPEGTGLRALVPPAQGEDAVPTTRAVAPGWPTRAPAAVTSGLAESMAMEAGDVLSLRTAALGTTVDFDVVTLVDVLPGAPGGSGILTDLSALSMATAVLIAPNELWVASADATGVADAVEAMAPETSSVTADPRAALSAADTVGAFRLSALGVSVLACVVLVMRRSSTRVDSRELALLDVLGLGRRGAQRVRAVEDIVGIIVGMVGGVIAGIAAAWFAVPALARAAYPAMPSEYPVPIQVDAVLLSLGVVLCGIVFITIAASVRAPRDIARWLREDE